MGTKLERIRELAAQNPKIVFTSLYQLIDADLLKQCHREMDGRKATGVDRVTKDAYETKLEENLSNLVTRLKEKNYRPQPSLRIYIPKANGKRRPLEIAAYEDKLVQDALSRVLSAVFEGRLHDSMHGFRPNRNCCCQCTILPPRLSIFSAASVQPRRPGASNGTDIFIGQHCHSSCTDKRAESVNSQSKIHSRKAVEITAKKQRK